MTKERRKKIEDALRLVKAASDRGRLKISAARKFGFPPLRGMTDKVNRIEWSRHSDRRILDDVCDFIDAAERVRLRRSAAYRAKYTYIERFVRTCERRGQIDVLLRTIGQLDLMKKREEQK